MLTLAHLHGHKFYRYPGSLIIMKRNSWKIYLRNGTVYVPTVARAGGHLGYFLDIDPVTVVSATNTEALKHAIIEAMSKGNPIVPTPTRATFPKPVVLKYAKVRSWSAFEKNTLVWTISKQEENFQINPKGRRADRGWEDDIERVETLPPGTTPDIAAQRVTSLVQLAAENAI